MSLVHLCCNTCRRLLRVKAAALPRVSVYAQFVLCSRHGWVEKSVPKSGGILAHESKPWHVCAAEQSPIPRRDLWVPLGPQRLRVCEQGRGSARSSSCRGRYHGNWQGSGCESTASRVPQKCFPSTHTHTHISSQCSGRNLSPRRFLVSSFPLTLIPW